MNTENTTTKKKAQTRRESTACLVCIWIAALMAAVVFIGCKLNPDVWTVVSVPLSILGGFRVVSYIYAMLIKD